jgi:hypothetical protein
MLILTSSSAFGSEPPPHSFLQLQCPNTTQRGGELKMAQETVHLITSRAHPPVKPQKLRNLKQSQSDMDRHGVQLAIKAWG